MRVEVHDRARVIPKPCGYHRDRLAILEQKRSVGVAETMHRDVSHLGPIDSLSEPASQTAGVEGSAIRSREHPVGLLVALWPCPCGEPQFALMLHLLPQERDRLGVEVD